MAKTYINAELQIVRMNNKDIVTTSTMGIGDAKQSGNWNAQAPDRRRSIWD
ncbi:MAG: hypothetical protein J6T19_02455 [Paludibacteraceae bacterium]|nr:hypothetical protein [Paludibacteraceae bacterium]